MSETNPNRQQWMSDDQWRCSLVAAKYKYGFHHLDNLRKCGAGVMIDEPSEIATYDFNALTRLVVFAHDECVRVGVSTENRTERYEDHEWEQTFLVITFHPRKREGERQFQRHPELEQHIADIRAA